MNLVFASGFLASQHLVGHEYFRDVQTHMAAAGHRVLCPTVPPIGTCEVRARVLADAITRTFPEGPVHVLAHSMGGLDLRTLIGHNLNGLARPGRIRSLTTLATPHRGSPVADLLTGPADGVRRVLYEAVQRAIGALGLEHGALENLTTAAAARVPDAARTHPHIRYHSYVASGRPGRRATCLVLAPTHRYLQRVTGEANDGLVTVASAMYGEVQAPFWPCDHVDMVGHNLDTADLGGFVFDHLAALDAIVRTLPVD